MAAISVLLELGDWAPDASTYLASSQPVAKGTYPRADGTDGPLQGPVVASNALAAAPRGAFSARDNTGTSWVVAGTAGKLYVQSGLSWTDRSGAAYAVPTGGHWRFTQFGERVLATNYADAIQTHTLASGANFANLSAGAPLAKYIATVEPGFCMVGFYSSAGVQSGGLWWSALGDATSWPTTGTAAAAAVQSDLNILPGGGAITGILPAVGGSAAAIFCERSIYRCEYVGPPAIFAFREVDRSRGCVAPQSLIQIGSLAYFLSEDGFCAFDGSSVKMIGAGRMDQFVLADMDQSQFERVYAGVDYAKKIVIWAYCTPGATQPNRWAVYSYATDRWRYCDDASIVTQYLFSARAPGYTLDTLDTPLPGGPDGSPSVGFPVDSPLYQGGSRFVAGFDTSSRLVSFGGGSLAARIETSDADVEGSRIFVSSILPITDASSVRCGVGWRSNLYDTVTYTTATAPGWDNRCPQRTSGQYVRAFATVDAGTVWEKFKGFRLNGFRDGER